MVSMVDHTPATLSSFQSVARSFNTAIMTTTYTMLETLTAETPKLKMPVPQHSMASTNSEITRVFDGLKGQTIHIPDLRPHYARWASGINRHYEQLLPLINQRIDKYFDDEKSRRKARKIDLARFACLTYPSAGWEQVKTMALLSFFLFLWDDMVDRELEPGMVDIASDLDCGNKFRRASTDYVNHFLRVTDGDAPEGFHKLLGSFNDVADVCTTRHRAQLDVDLLAYDFNDFFQCNQFEQELRLSGKVPTIEEYWRFRYGVSAVAIYCDMHQYVADVKLPAELAWCEEVKTMRMETSAQPCISNDLFSLKKEMAEGTSANLIPILVKTYGYTAEEAAQKLSEQITASSDKFDQAKASLRAKGQAYDEATQKDLDKFIEAFETFQTGCFFFYATSKRFCLDGYEREDGSFKIPL